MKHTHFGNRGNVDWKSLTAREKEWKLARGYKWLTDDKPMWYTNTGLAEQKKLMRERMV